MTVGRPAVIDVTYQKIAEWCTNPIESDLPEEQKQIFNRWNKADDVMDKYPVRKTAIAVYKKKFPNLSDRTIAYDFANARKLFNNIKKVEKDWVRRWLINDIFKAIEKYKNAGEKGYKAWNAAHTNLIKAAGLDKEEKEFIDPEILQQHNYFTVINLNGELVKTDLNQFHNLPISTRKELAANLLTSPITEDVAAEIMDQ